MNLAQFTTQIATTGGATYNIVTGDSPNSGYAASMEGHEKVINLPDTWESMSSSERGTYIKPHVLDFIVTSGTQLETAWDYIGAWTHDGKVYLDVTRVFDNLYDAVLFGILNNQKAIYDFNKDESIELPEGQTHGTMTQAMDYAKMTATAISHKILTGHA
jgi:hypothetical protein